MRRSTPLEETLTFLEPPNPAYPNKSWSYVASGVRKIMTLSLCAQAGRELLSFPWLSSEILSTTHGRVNTVCGTPSLYEGRAFWRNRPGNRISEGSVLVFVV